MTKQQQEKALFLARLKEVGATGQWGIFSMAIPGRVGYQVLASRSSLFFLPLSCMCLYAGECVSTRLIRVLRQCANFYRHLVRNGEIKDPKYKVDLKGRLKFVRDADPNEKISLPTDNGGTLHDT
jgi:hypothetical protein